MSERAGCTVTSIKPNAAWWHWQANSPNAEGTLRRALNQAARELLLAQSSDWPFLISQQTAVPYAMSRFRGHIHTFQRLRQQISSQTIDEVWLQTIESRNSIFPRLDYRVFCGRKTAGESVQTLASIQGWQG